MLRLTLQEFEKYLYTKLSLDKTDYYRVCYKAFSSYLDTRELNENTCAEFLTDLRSRGKSPYTYNNFLQALKHLVRAHGHSFLDAYKLLKTEQPYIPILDEIEMRSLLQVTYKLDYRRAVATEVFLRTELRCDELIDLAWKNVREECLFIVNTKSSRSREYMLHLFCQQKSMR